MDSIYDCFDRSDEARDSCVVPDNIPSGIQVRRLSSKAILKSGDAVKNTRHIVYKCTDTDYETIDQCLNGKWANENVPKCEYCTIEDVIDDGLSFSDASCTRDGKTVNCTGSLKSDTVVNATCKSNYSRENPDDSYYHCDNGKWDIKPEPCRPFCGTTAPFTGSTGELIVPWHAAIFIREQNKTEQQCCGSIIGPKTIISAAHCFWPLTMSVSKIEVGVGLFYNDYENIKNNSNHLFGISDIHINPAYKKPDNDQFEGDIAILTLNKSIELTANIQPVCIHFPISETPTEGSVYGWRLINSINRNENELKSLDVPIIEVNQCKEHLKKEPNFNQNIIPDKICAGYMNESNGIRPGDSGTGLVIIASDKKYYIYGILSNTPKIFVRGTYALYTDITYYYNNFVSKYTL